MSLLCSTLLFSFAVQISFISVPGQKIATAAQVNGTWRGKAGTFKIWALGKQKLQVEFLGVYEYNTEAGPMAHTGEGTGIAFIEADTATFKPEGSEEDCKIMMRFRAQKLIVDQEGVCRFGHNVTAKGTYRKVSSAKPKFGEGVKTSSVFLRVRRRAQRAWHPGGTIWRRARSGAGRLIADRPLLRWTTDGMER